MSKKIVFDFEEFDTFFVDSFGQDFYMDERTNIIYSVDDPHRVAPIIAYKIIKED